MDYPTRLEVNPRGFWEIRWTEPDARVPGRGRTRTASTRTKDRATAEKIMRAFVKADAQAPAGPGGPTVSAVMDEYEAAITSRGVGRTQIGGIAHIRRVLGDDLVTELTPERIRDYERGRGVAPGTCRRELNVLVAALAWAAKHGKIPSPPPPVDLPAQGEARAVFLAEDVEAELFQLAAESGTRVGLFICIALDTGARKSAVEGLTWDRVDLVRGTVDFRDPAVRTTKKRRVSTPIPARLLPVLQKAHAARAEGERFVLGHDGNVKKAFATFMAKHKFEDVTPHVLRHTRITLLLRAGVSLWDVSALVGASPRVITEVYGHHVADDRLRAEANKRAA